MNPARPVQVESQRLPSGGAVMYDPCESMVIPTGATVSVNLCWGQQWAWQQQEMPPDRRSPSLIFTCVMSLPEQTRLGDVQAALRMVTARHAALRSTVSAGPGRPPQSVVWSAEADGYDLARFDDREHGERWLRDQMDIGASWPLRVAVLGRGPMRLGIAAHHIASDRYGFDLLCRELRLALRATLRRTTPPLPPVGRQPADIAAFERSAAGAAVSRRAIEYWLDHRAELDVAVCVLGARFDTTSGAMHVARAVSVDAKTSLSTLATAAHSSEASVAVAAIASVLAGHLGTQTVPFYLTSANRHLTGLKHSVCSVAQAGLASVSVPAPNDLPRLVPAASKATLAALSHAYYDGSALAERARAAGGPGPHPPVSPPSINILHSDDSSPPGGGHGLPATAHTTRADRPCLGLNFHVRLTTASVSVELRAGTHLLSASECRELVAGTLRLLLDASPATVHIVR